MAGNDYALSVEEVRSLMDSFRKNKLGGMKLTRGNFSLELSSRDVEYAAPGPTAAFTATLQAPESDEEMGGGVLSGHVVTSPIVGTFYGAPSPEKPPYVQAGQAVKKGDVLFIIESMKLMNEVASDYDGVVSQILVEDAQGVEFGQPILCIE